MFANQRNELHDLVRIDLLNLDGTRGALLDFAALFQPSTGQHDLAEHFRVRGALLHHHAANTTRSDNQYFRHASLSRLRIRT